MDNPTALNQSGFGKITSGYAEWVEGERTASPKIEFGTWWRLNETYWRVSWIEATGELFAVERKPSDRFLVLSACTKKEISELMKKWFDGDNLEALVHRFHPDALQETQ